MLVAALRHELASGVQVFSAGSRSLYQSLYPRSTAVALPAVVSEACCLLRHLTSASRPVALPDAGDDDITSLSSGTECSDPSLCRGQTASDLSSSGALGMMLDVLVHFEFSSKHTDTLEDLSAPRLPSHAGLLPLLNPSRPPLSSLQHSRLLCAASSSSQPALASLAMQVLANLLTLDPSCCRAFNALRGCEVVSLLLAKYRNVDRAVAMQALRLMTVAAKASIR